MLKTLNMSTTKNVDGTLFDALRPDGVTIMYLLTIEDLAKVLHKSVSTLQSDLHRAPHRLPPVVRLPANRRPLWRPADVVAWINGHVVVPVTPPRPYRRGRPCKREQIERQRSQ